MNSVFQQLFMQPAIRAGVLAAAEVPASERADSVFGQLQVRGAAQGHSPPACCAAVVAIALQRMLGAFPRTLHAQRSRLQCTISWHGTATR